MAVSDETRWAATGGAADVAVGVNQTWLACLLVLLLPAVLWAQNAGARERVVILMDCSGSMKHQVDGGTSRFEQALSWAVDEARVSLAAGAVVQAVPFDEVPLDGFGAKFWLEPGEELKPKVERVRQYLRGFGPRSEWRKTAIWDTILALEEFFRLAGPTTVSVYTDGEDNRSKASRRDVQRHLRELWKMNEQQALGLRVWQWTPKARPPQVAVRLLAETPPSLSRAAFARGGGTASFEMPLEAVFAGPTTPQDALTGLSVSVSRLSRDAPPLQGEITLNHPLNAKTPRGVATVRLTGTFQQAEFDHRYYLRFRFQFRSGRQDLPADRRRYPVDAAQGLRLGIASSPQPQLEVQQPGPLRLFPGQRKQVPLRLSGNADAEGQVCNVYALVPRGLKVGISAADVGPATGDPAAEPKMQGKGRLRRSVKMPRFGQALNLTLHVEAEQPVEATLPLTAAIGGVNDDAKLSVQAQQPVVRAKLARPGARTLLPEPEPHPEGQPEASPKQVATTELPWRRLDAGPLRLDTGGLSLPGVKLRLSPQAPDDGTAVALAFDPNGKQAIQLDLAGPDPVELFARWRQFPPPPDAARLPDLKLEVVSDPKRRFIVQLEPETLDLASLIALRQADVWLSPAETGDDARGGGVRIDGRTLTLPKRTLRAGNRDDRQVLLQWNAAARGARLMPQTSPPADAALSLQPLSGFSHRSGDASATPAGFVLDQPDTLLGRVGLNVQAPPQPGDVVYEARLEVAHDEAEIEPWTLLLPYEIVPPLATVTVEGAAVTEAEALPVFLGAAMPVGSVAVRGDGEPGQIRVRFETPTDSGIKLQAGLGENASPTLSYDGRGPSRALLLAEPTADPAALGQTFEATLVVEPVSELPSAVLAASVGGDRNPTLRIPFQFELTAWSIRVLYAGRDCQRLPPVGSLSVGSEPATLRSTQWRRPLELVLDGALPLPEDLADHELSAKLVDDGGGLFTEARFELAGDAPPQPTVSLANVRDGRVVGLQVTATPPDKPVSFSEVVTGKLALVCPPLAIRHELPLQAVREPSVSPLLYVVTGLGGLLLAIVCALVIRRLILGATENKPTQPNDPPTTTPKFDPNRDLG